MVPIITSNAIITCIHGGQVVLVPKQVQVTIQGGSVLCEPDLVGSIIVGCAQPPTPTTKPCTARRLSTGACLRLRALRPLNRYVPSIAELITSAIAPNK
jgi:hypothetical protein